MAPVIEVQNLKKYFPTPRGMLHAVDDVTFTIEKGKTLGVVASPAAASPRWDGPLSTCRRAPPARSFWKASR